MGPQSNRPRTEFNVLAAVRASSPSQSPAEAGLQDLQDSRQAVQKANPDMRAEDRIETISPETDKSKSKQIIRLRTESPWQRYDKIYDLDLGGPVEVAICKTSPVVLVHIRTFSKPASEKALHWFRTVQHRNIIAALDFFAVGDCLYTVLEYMPISLEHIVKSPAYPDERQLAIILRQILSGLDYLAAGRLEHGSLVCSNILLNTEGVVKIAHQECCQVRSNSGNISRDIRAMSRITMELMQKYTKEDGAVGIDDLLRWNSNSDAVGFLSATTSAVSASELLQHPLLTHTHDKGLLSGIISLAQVCFRGRYKL